jgi:hypothetical protein
MRHPQAPAQSARHEVGIAGLYGRAVARMSEAAYATLRFSMIFRKSVARLL